MKIGTLCREALIVACVMGAALAGGATPPATEDTLDDAVVPGQMERERPPRRTGIARQDAYAFNVGYRNGASTILLTLRNIREREVLFRRESRARQLALESLRAPGDMRVVLSDDRLAAASGNRTLNTAFLTLEAGVDEMDGLPAAIPFGSNALLVNLDYLRLRHTRYQTQMAIVNGINPQTRRCTNLFTLLDDEQEGSNRFILVNDSLRHCQSTERRRELGDLLFADGPPEKLRQAVLDVYGPAVGLANRLGSEPALLFVAWRPDSPYKDFRLERSWDRTTLLLFNGSEWEDGVDAQQREALRATFVAEQILRRIRLTDWPGAFTESAASYLKMLFTAEQAGNTQRWLSRALPAWISGCAGDLARRNSTAAAATEVISVDCGLLVQFVYDAVARAKSGGRDKLYDTWKHLLTESYRHGESGATTADFMESSAEARRITQGLLDGTMDWTRFAAELSGLGVRLDLRQNEMGPFASVALLRHFRDQP